MKLLLLLSCVFLLSACSHYGHKGHHGKRDHWKTMDANSDGKVSKAEFTKAHEAKFTAMDANKDGSVTKEEKMAYKKGKCTKGKKHDCSKDKGDCTEESCKLKK